MKAEGLRFTEMKVGGTSLVPGLSDFCSRASEGETSPFFLFFLFFSFFSFFLLLLLARSAGTATGTVCDR